VLPAAPAAVDLDVAQTAVPAQPMVEQRRPAMAELLRRLHARLVDGDATARALVVDHGTELVQAFGDSGRKLVDRVLHFDFEAAHSLLESLPSAADVHATT
jgi:hypothetical protein